MRTRARHQQGNEEAAGAREPDHRMDQLAGSRGIASPTRRSEAVHFDREVGLTVQYSATMKRMIETHRDANLSKHFLYITKQHKDDIRIGRCSCKENIRISGMTGTSRLYA